MKKLSLIEEGLFTSTIKRGYTGESRKEDEINRGFIIDFLENYSDSKDKWDIDNPDFSKLGKKFEKELENKKNVISVNDEITPDGTFFILLFSKDKNIFSIFDTHQERRRGAPKFLVAYTWGVKTINGHSMWVRIDDGVSFATSLGRCKTIREMYGNDLFYSIDFYEYAIIVK